MNNSRTLKLGDLNNNEENDNNSKSITKTSICCIPNCNGYQGKVLLFPFPDKNIDLLTHRCWLREVRKQASYFGKSFELNEGALVCESHFRDEDIITNRIAGTMVLREGSIPVFFSGNMISEIEKSEREEDQSSTENEKEEVQLLKEIKPIIDESFKMKNKEKTLEDLENELKEKEKALKQRRIKDKKYQQDLTIKQKLHLEKEQQEEKLKELLVQQQYYKKMKKQQVVVRDEKELQDNLPMDPEIEEQNKGKEILRKSRWQQQKKSLQEMLRQEQEKLYKIHQQEITKKPQKQQRCLKESVIQSPSREHYLIDEPPCKKCFKLEHELGTLKERLKNIEAENRILQLELKRKIK